MPQPFVTTLDHLVLTVRSIPTTVAFYSSAMGMQPEQFKTTDGTTRWALKFGTSKINLHEASREFEPKALAPTPGSADLCFLTETGLTDWQSHFKAQGVAIEEGPIPRTGATGPLTSIYIRDPDKNLIEISVRNSADN